MPPVGFEPAISAGELPQTYPLDRAAPGTGMPHLTLYNTSKGRYTRPQLKINDQIFGYVTMLLYILMLQIGIPISRYLNFELCYSEYFSKSPPPFYVHNIACSKENFCFF